MVKISFVFKDGVEVQTQKEAREREAKKIDTDPSDAARFKQYFADAANKRAEQLVEGLHIYWSAIKNAAINKKTDKTAKKDVRENRNKKQRRHQNRNKS